MLAPPGPIARKAVNLAVEEIGVREAGNNRGKRVEMYQKAASIGPGEPWCAAFVVWCLSNATASLKKAYPAGCPRSGYTPDWAEWGKQHGRWIQAEDAEERPDLVKRGDLILFYKPKLKRIGHIGFVGHCGPDGVWTIEGNTNEAGSREGDGVYRKLRTWEEIVMGSGFVRLPF